MNCLVLANTMKKPSVPDKAPLPDPAQDGVDHINVHYNHSKTQLGRQLATYYVARFEHPYFGPFKCIEGFLLYAKTGCQDDEFRNLTGTQAKAYYRKQMDAGKLKNYDIPNQGHLMLTAYHARLTQYPVIAETFQESTLPFDSYYIYRVSGLPIRPPESAVLTHTLMTLRELMKQGKAPPPMSNDEYAKLIIR